MRDYISGFTNSENLIIVTISEIDQLSYYDREKLGIELGADRGRFKKIVDGLSNISGIRTLSLDYAQMDWHSGCGTFYVPYYTYTTKYTEGETPNTEIPKKWSRDISIMIEGGEYGYKGVIKFIELVGIDLTPREKEIVKNGIERKEYFEVDI